MNSENEDLKDLIKQIIALVLIFLVVLLLKNL
jgi:hypothetical protein